MADIQRQIKHLREYPLYSLGAIASCKKAADTIESQRARIELLEKVLEAAVVVDSKTIKIGDLDNRRKLHEAIADCDG